MNSSKTSKLVIPFADVVGSSVGDNDTDRIKIALEIAYPSCHPSDIGTVLLEAKRLSCYRAGS
jgi:hypothetical protein